MPVIKQGEAAKEESERRHDAFGCCGISNSRKGDMRYGRGGQNAERARHGRDGECSRPQIFLRPLALKADEHANPDGDRQLGRDSSGWEDC
jgi:hypothetical protein